MEQGRVILPEEGRTLTYAGERMRVITELAGFAIIEMTVSAWFRGPVPHRHDGFDEALYLLDGGLLLTYGNEEPVNAPAGAFCLAPRGVRHTFANPSNTPARVLGIWSPGPAGVAFMTDVGAALPPGGAPDPETMRELYLRHNSVLLP